MSSKNLSPIFKAFLSDLNSAGIEYLLVGGYAVRYHGYLRPTRDLDIWTSTSHTNAVKISRLTSSWTQENPLITPALFEHPNRIVRLGNPTANLEIVEPIIDQKAKVLYQVQAEVPGQIEILTVQTGAEFNDCFASRLVDEIDGITVNIISLKDLITIKQAGNRPQDIVDLNHLG